MKNSQTGSPPPQINNQPQFLLTRFCEILQLPRCVILEDYYLIYLMKSIFIYITNLYSFIEMGRHTVPVYLYLNEMLPMIASHMFVSFQHLYRAISVAYVSQFVNDQSYIVDIVDFHTDLNLIKFNIYQTKKPLLKKIHRNIKGRTTRMRYNQIRWFTATGGIYTIPFSVNFATFQLCRSMAPPGVFLDDNTLGSDVLIQ